MKNYRLVLMELFAIITIIILLITLLLPICVKSREWAKSIKCNSNLKALGTAAISYINDSKGVLPYYMSYTSSSNLGVGWLGAMLSPLDNNTVIKNAGVNSIIKLQNTLGYIPTPRVKKGISGSTFTCPADYSNIFACPSQKNEDYNMLLYSQIGTYYNWAGTHYTINYGAFIVYSQIYAHNLNKTALIGDGVYGNYINYTGGTYVYQKWVYGRHFGIPVFNASTFNSMAKDIPYEEHGPGRANWIFLDGHIESWSWRMFFNKYSVTVANPFYSGKM